MALSLHNSQNVTPDQDTFIYADDTDPIRCDLENFGPECFGSYCA